LVIEYIFIIINAVTLVVSVQNVFYYRSV